MELSVTRKRLARLVLFRLVLLLLRRFGVDGLLVPLGRGLQLGRVVLRSLVPYALDELAARVDGAGVYAAESHLEGVPIHLELLARAVDLVLRAGGDEDTQGSVHVFFCVQERELGACSVKHHEVL